jgi:hypothetical protein
MSDEREVWVMEKTFIMQTYVGKTLAHIAVHDLAGVVVDQFWYRRADVELIVDIMREYRRTTR